MDRARQAALRAILFTDMVGSTQLRTRLGDDRADALRRAHDTMLGSAVTTHGGRVLRWTGDGLKADFPTASAALDAAIEVQRSVAAYARTPQAVAPFQVRIGIAVGEVLIEGNEAHGIAVIEAARLEPLAQPGQILATDLVQRLGQRRVDAEFEEVGSYTLKGLDRPVSVVRVVDTAAQQAIRPLPRTLAQDRRFPLVGRADDLAACLAAWDDTRQGGSALVTVAGQPGIGKSRLLAQVATRAHEGGALVVAGTCDADLAVPYQPLATGLPDAAAADAALAAAVADGEGPLGPLFPARRADLNDDAGPSARFDLFEAVNALLDRLTEAQPVVLVLEDLQWASAPTVQLLCHVARRPHQRLLVLTNHRVDDVGTTHPLQALLTDQQLATTTTHLELRALAVADVAELVSARVPIAPDDNVAAFARRVVDESAGSPFFVCELLDHLTSTGALERLVEHGGGDQLPIPDTVREVVTQRLARLPSGTNQILTTAAVIGATFDVELLAQLSDGDEDRVLDGCEDAAQAALVTEVGPDTFAFAHAIVRATLLGELSSSRKVRAHRRVAEAIERLGRPDHDELAHHWRLAGDLERADANSEQAARRDLEALAFESAADRYRQLVDHQQARGDDETALGRAWLGLGVSLRSLGNNDYLDAIEEAGRLARRVNDVELLIDAALAALWPGTYFVNAADAEAWRIELVEHALAVSDDGDRRRTRLLCTLAALQTFAGDRTRRNELLDEAVDLARRSGDPAVVGSALVAEYLCTWDASTVEPRAELVKEIARMARSSGDVDLEFYAGFLGAISAAEHCNLTDARRKVAELDRPVKASANAYFGFLTERLSVSFALLAGEPDAQEAIDSLATRHEASYADTDGTWALQTAYLTKQTTSLAGYVDTVRSMIEESAIPQRWQAPLGLALLHAGDLDGANAVLDELEEPPLDYFWITTQQTTAELAVGLRRLDVCQALYDALLPNRGQLGITSSGTLFYGLVSTTLGELALALGDEAGARELLDEALATSEEIGATFEVAKVRSLRDRLPAAAG